MFSRRLIDSAKNSSNNNINVNQSEFLEAINNNDSQKVENFLNDPNILIWHIKDENGRTALHYSVFKNNYEHSKQIIEKVKKEIGLGSSNKLEKYINEKTDEGFTALHYAAINGNIKIIKLLKEFGAKIESVTNLGKNVIHIASENNQPSTIIYFVLNEPLDIFSVDENGSTPLHWASYSGSVESVIYLLSLKANINAVDREKFTPLHLAVSKNREKIVRLLLRNGADKNITNNNKELPIDIARKKNYMNIVELLEDKYYNPLCTLEFPNKFIPPNDIYRKLLFLIIIIPEIIIFLLVLPFLEKMHHTFVNLITFLLCLLSYIFLIYKGPGYQKDHNLINECEREKIKNPLQKLIDNEVDLRNICPICYVENSNNNDNINIKHCIICNKCVLEFSHHCFWINKCIGKNNKYYYLIFIFASFLFTSYSIFICFNLLFDNVYISYEKAFPPSWLTFNFDRGFRVLGAGLTLVFEAIISFPLFFLFMIQIIKLKSSYLLKKKKNINLFDDTDDKNINNLEIKNNADEPLIYNINKENNEEEINNNINELNVEMNENNKNKDNKENNINNDEDIQKINIPNENFPLVDGRLTDESKK